MRKIDPTKRYFCVFFQANYDSEPFYGNMDLYDDDGFHLNKRAATIAVATHYGIEEDDIVILGFQELTPHDYRDWSE
jgi:hypothetical protein